MKKSKRKLFVSLSGLAGGFINGFLGSGGGVVILNGLLKSGVEKRKAHASCVFAVLPLSLVSAFFYKEALPGDMVSQLPLFAGCAVGGAVGAFFLSRINKVFLELVFDGLIIYSGIRMIL